ncbi:MAG: arginine--tRNA ligase [Candidatus Omnitrophica bacterium]|nr:arginine--tRNA ligase [Candidatus Omnitrophota bacterium]
MKRGATLEDSLSYVLRQALRQVERGGAGGRFSDGPLTWEIPKDPSFGDLSNSISFKVAAAQNEPPQQFAEALLQAFLSCCRQAGADEWIERVEAKAGFLNVFLSRQALTQVLRSILRQGRRYGMRRVAPAPAINIEFVSANPTGPLSVAHGRQAAVGDVLARLLRSQGCHVTTEYYLNDEGRQIELLGRSIRLRYAELLGRPEPFPEEGYHGAYLYPIAQECVKRFGDRLLCEPEAKTLPTFIHVGQTHLLEEIRKDLARFGLPFDRWSSQRWLRVCGRIDASLQTLRSRGALYESEEATWFASTRFGDDKDRVVRKRDGELTYLAPDIAYHQWKFQRGYDQILNLWGPDHHGYIGRLKAAVMALGLPADRLVVRIVQLVTLSRRGKPVPMSKRQGEFVTFREVLDEVGADATRFFFLMRTMESHLDVDLELAKSQSQENPVYYVQYAHARICSILAKERLPWWARCRPNLGLLQEPEERLLMRWLFQYPTVLRLSAAALEPHGLTVYLRKLAEGFHVFYTKHRVISDDPKRSAARLALVRATRHVLANGLGILGISAPRRM